jgi:SAM-dependent methyltransferase
MISPRLVDVARCPDCGARLTPTPPALRCTGCGRVFDASGGYLDLRPRASFAEQTKYLDHELHTDARHEAIAPPVLGSKIRHDMLRQFLAPGPGDRIVDLGCGSGRAIAWTAHTGASILGVDISPFFAAEAVQQSDLILGDLRRLPLADAAFNKAWSLDVLEHLSAHALGEVLAEANRVLEPGGGLFIYTHVRRNGWPALGVRFVNQMARLCERAGLIDLRQERLRKSDHLNPIPDHEALGRVVADHGFRIERITYYSPVIGALVENLLARMAERALASRARRRLAPTTVDREAASVRVARAAAQARVRRGGLTYGLLAGLSVVMKIDLVLFGRIRSGPFFALLRKTGPTVGAPGLQRRGETRQSEDLASTGLTKPTDSGSMGPTGG